MGESSARKKINFGKSAETYNLIVDSAEMLIQENGINFFTMQDVAHKSGFGVGTIYLYFDNKECLFESLVRRHMLNIFKKYQSEVVQLLPLEPKEMLYHLFLVFLKDPKSKVLAELFAMTSVLFSRESGEPIFSLLLNSLQNEIKESFKISLDQKEIESKTVMLLHSLRAFLSINRKDITSASGIIVFNSDEDYATWLTNYSLAFISINLSPKKNDENH